MATPSSAEAASGNGNDQTSTGSLPVIPALSTADSSTEAVQAMGQSAVGLQLDAERIKAAEAARKKAAEKAEAARTLAEAPSRSYERPFLPGVGGSTRGVLGFLRAQVGKAYVFGANGPTAYDCSGLTKAAFATIGVDLPRTSQQQSTFGTPVSVSDVQPGDLLFWGGTGSAYHVAVYIGGGEYLDAANPGKGVVIQEMSYYMPDSARRVA